MINNFIEKLSSNSDFSKNSLETIKNMLSYFQENTNAFDSQLSWIIENWKYNKITEKEEFLASYPILQFLDNYSSGISLITLTNLDFDDVLKVSCDSFPEFNFYQAGNLNEEEIDEIAEFYFRFQIAWSAFRWQELNGKSIGYEAYIFVNNSGEEFYLSNFSSEINPQFKDSENYPIFENEISSQKLTLFEVYEKVLEAI